VLVLHGFLALIRKLEIFSWDGRYQVIFVKVVFFRVASFSSECLSLPLQHVINQVVSLVFELLH